jgi:hypothetical protein
MIILAVILAAWFWLWLVSWSAGRPFWGGFWATLPLWGPIAFFIGYSIWDAAGLTQVPVDLLIATAWLLAFVIPAAVGTAILIKQILTGKTRG